MTKMTFEHGRSQGIKAIVVAVALAMAMAPAQAGLQDALDGMFMNNVTAAQAYNSQTRGGFVGGGAALRAPIRNINLVAFDPPRFSAGCGGIDLYGGSFTFIKSDQLPALFRQIASGAVGAAFKLAIDAINPQLGKIMEDFQNKLQQLNSMLKNTCAISNQIVKSFTDPDARTELANTASNAVNTVTGAVDDLFEGLNGLFTDPTAPTQKAGGDCGPCGNLVWKALSDSNAGQLLGNPATGGDADPTMGNQLVMSMLGTVIMPSSKSDINSNSDGTIKPPDGSWRAGIIGLYDLRDGSAKKPMNYYDCLGDTARDGCTHLALSGTPLTFEGTLGYTNRMLFGSADESNGVQSGSIIDLLTTCNSTDCGFTAEHRRFISSVSAPLLKMMRDVQSSPGAMQIVAQQLAPIIADELAAKYGEAALKAARSAFSGVNSVTKPDQVAQRERELFDEMMKLRSDASNQTDRFLKAKQYVDVIVASNPAVFARVSSR